MEAHGPFAEDSSDEQKEMKTINAKCGHVKRRLVRNDPLSGKVLDFALSVIEQSRERTNDTALLDRISRKLANEEELSDYEAHIMIDVLLLHKRLVVKI